MNIEDIGITPDQRFRASMSDSANFVALFKTLERKGVLDEGDIAFFLHEQPIALNYLLAVSQATSLALALSAALGDPEKHGTIGELVEDARAIFAIEDLPSVVRPAKEALDYLYLTEEQGSAYSDALDVLLSVLEKPVDKPIDDATTKT